MEEGPKLGKGQTLRPKQKKGAKRGMEGRRGGQVHPERGEFMQKKEWKNHLGRDGE